MALHFTNCLTSLPSYYLESAAEQAVLPFLITKQNKLCPCAVERVHAQYSIGMACLWTNTSVRISSVYKIGKPLNSPHTAQVHVLLHMCIIFSHTFRKSSTDMQLCILYFRDYKHPSIIRTPQIQVPICKEKSNNKYPLDYKYRYDHQQSGKYGKLSSLYRHGWPEGLKL